MIDETPSSLHLGTQPAPTPAETSGGRVSRKGVFLRGVVLPTALIALALLPSLVAYHNPRSLGSRDFRNLYSSGILLREGRLYDIERESKVQAAATGGWLDTPIPYSHPPFVALLLMPLTLLSYSSAYYSMLGCNLLLLAAALWLLTTRFHYNVRQMKALTFNAVALFPLYATLLQGQLSFIALLLLTLFITELDHERRPGCWAGLMCFKPSLMLVPFLVLAFRRKWQAFWLGCLVGVILSGLSLYLVGWQGVRDWLDVLHFVTSGGRLSTTRLAMSNLRALSLFLGGGTWIAVLLALGVLALLWLRRENHLVIVLSTILVAPHLYSHDLAIGLVAIAIAVFLAPGQYPGWAAIASLPVLIALAIQGAWGYSVPIVPVSLLAVLCVCGWTDWGRVDARPLDSGQRR